MRSEVKINKSTIFNSDRKRARVLSKCLWSVEKWMTLADFGRV